LWSVTEAGCGPRIRPHGPGVSEPGRVKGTAMRTGFETARGIFVVVLDAPNRGQSTDVHDGLVELGLLREDGLVTDEEYRQKRTEILGRL